MSSKLFFVILLILAGAVIFGFRAKPKQGLPAIDSSQNVNLQVSSVLSAQTKTMGLIEVEVTPVSATEGKEVVFDLIMNNHSVDLNYDYMKIANLSDNQGHLYKPLSWTGNSEGHHIRGQLIFAPFSKMPKKLTLTLDGVDNKKEAFVWQM